MDRYIESVKNSLKNSNMKYEKIFIHPEEYGNDKINKAIKDSSEDIATLDKKIKEIAASTNDLLERTVKRLDVVMDIITSEKERLQDIVMLCNNKTDYENAISLTDTDFSGEFNYDNGLFSCKSSHTTAVSGTVSTVEGNGYIGNKYVVSDTGYQEKTLSTKNAAALLDSNLSTY